MGWLRAFLRTAREGLTVQRRWGNPAIAVRGTVGAAIALILPGLLGWDPVASSAGVAGAFAAGMTAFHPSFRARPVLASVAAVGMAAATLAGALSADHWWLLVPVTAVWTLACGLAWAMGPTAGIVAASTLTALLALGTLELTLGQRLLAGAAALGGGAVQALLMVLWPMRHWEAQRTALGAAVDSMARYAEDLRTDPVAPLDPLPLMEARAASEVTSWQARYRPPELHGVRGTVERIRPVLAALADPRVGAGRRRQVDELLAASAEVLAAVAGAVRAGGAVRVPSSAREVLARYTAGGRDPAGGSAPGVVEGVAARAATRLVALLGELEDIVTVGRAGTGLHRPGVLSTVPEAWRTAREHAASSSPVWRHAVRVTAVVVALLVAALALPWPHGVWMPLTAALVMRPNFVQTWGRGVARVVGTVVGAGVGSAILAWSDPGRWATTGWVAGFAALSFVAVRAGYVVLSATVTVYVVLLLHLSGAGAGAGLDRVSATVLGGAVALWASAALFPVWDTARLADRLAEWARASGRYAAAVIEAFEPLPDESGGAAGGHRATAAAGAAGARPAAGATAAGATGATAATTATAATAPGVTAAAAASRDGTGGAGPARVAEHAGVTDRPGTPRPSAARAAGASAARAAGAAAARAAAAGGRGRGWVGPRVGARPVREALLEERRARATAEAIAERAVLEPVWDSRGVPTEAVTEVREGLVNLGRMATVLEAHLPRAGSPAGRVPGSAAFAARLRERMEGIAEALRGGAQVADAGLREPWERWRDVVLASDEAAVRAAGTAGTAGTAGVDAATRWVVVQGAGLMVDGVEDIVEGMWES
ncbi:FUSC family protein [Allostreptomyces psammosilenae]|uniref:Integral membrane bound transporter domain-containing protein n=1 Tax=Allostreptomyces psammosilenae TaxID=1892865 RepID=A0A852ZU77_9ACTN|nr:FUSC family protein [Allostreptomyces psammosilenae]NYI04324.1 hypothetical protein [Allostreptomyces psammosilenae]